jgi:ABC-2 type transport system permease protein
MTAFLALIRNDLLLYFSSRRALLMNILAPILIAGFFGAMFDSDTNKGPLRIPIAVVDLDRSEISGRIVAAMKVDTAFDIHELDADAARAQVKKGSMRASVRIPPGFGAALVHAIFSAQDKPVIAVDYDPSQAMTLAVVKGLLVQHVLEGVARSALDGGAGALLLAEGRQRITANNRLAPAQKANLLALLDDAQRARAFAGDRKAADAAASGRSGAAPGAAPHATANATADATGNATANTAVDTAAAAPANATSTTAANPAAADPPSSAAPGLQLPFATQEQAISSGADSKYNSYSHAFAGMGVQFILFMGIDLGVGLLLARRLGLWKRLRAAPLSRAALIGARMASGALIAFCLLMIIYAAAMAIFQVRIEGSLAGFLGVGVAFGVLTATFGLLIAALGKTPEATRGLAVFVTLLLVMLSGAWVPSFVFPEWLQQVSLFVPSRWAVDGLDAMTWRGLGLDAALAPIGVMLTFAAAFAALALWRFNWEE